MDSVYSTRL